MMRTEERIHRALEDQETLTQEMSHRLKNVFAMTDGMIRISSKEVETKDELAQVLSGRLHALARANGLVRRTFTNVGDTGQPSDLDSLIRTIVMPHDRLNADGEFRFVVEGPMIKCGEHAINAVALTFHELATNAAKYGVLTSDSGQIHVNWRLDDADIRIEWVERGGTEIVSAPKVVGFGSTLVHNTIVRQFNGTLNYDWRPSGLAVTITVPAESLTY